MAVYVRGQEGSKEGARREARADRQAQDVNDAGWRLCTSTSTSSFQAFPKRR